MKVLLLLILVIIVISIWAIIFANARITIKATNIRKLNKLLYQSLKIWSNNRLQTHRLRQSLVQREVMLAHSQQFAALSKDSELHELAVKVFRKLFIFQKKQKTNIIIPIGSNALAHFAKKELDGCLLELLMTYYPYHHWQQIELKRIPLTNYFYLTIRQK